MTETACRVLIADDDAMNRMVAIESLKYLGVDDVQAVSSGSEALEAMQRDAFDLALLDVHMPDMTGIEATMRIRAQEQATGGKRLPIVALTASATVKDQQSCLDAGMDGVLTKPYRIEQLETVLNERVRCARKQVE